MATSNLTFVLEAVKQTDNKVVFAEKRDETNPLSVRRVSGIYLDKRDLRDFGWTGEPLTLVLSK